MDEGFQLLYKIPFENIKDEGINSEAFE